MSGLVKHVLQKLGIIVEVRGCKGAMPCPFHDERTVGAFIIYVEGDRVGGFRCLSCGAHGGLVDFVERVRGCSREGAKEWIARLREGDVEEARSPVQRVELVVDRGVRRPFELPREVVRRPLDQWSETARRYAEQRHLTAGQVARWGVGYAVVGRLKGRLVIPVCDQHGAVQSYMARSFAGHSAKYFYPSLRDGPSLDAMFGEQHWPRHDRNAVEVVVCEGALNALAVERCYEGQPVAALGGSDPRALHVFKLAGFGRVCLLTDQDPAGDGAAAVLWRQLARHVEVRRVTLGVGRDADDVTSAELRGALWQDR